MSQMFSKTAHILFMTLSRDIPYSSIFKTTALRYIKERPNNYGASNNVALFGQLYISMQIQRDIELKEFFAHKIYSLSHACTISFRLW